MNTIDLNVIAEKHISDFHSAHAKIEGSPDWQIIQAMKETIHRIIVLANNELDEKIKQLKTQDFTGWTPEEEANYIAAATTIQIQGKQSILDVEKLVV